MTTPGLAIARSASKATPPAGSLITMVGTPTANGSSFGASSSIAYPAGIAAGDVAILTNKSQYGLTVPSGFTQLSTYDVYYRVLTGSETSVGLTFANSGSRATLLSVWRGVNNTTPIQNSNRSTTFTGTTVTSTALTTSTAGTCVLNIVNVGSPGTTVHITEPASPWTLVNKASGQTIANCGLVYRKDLGNGASTGAPSWSLDSATNTAFSEIVILNPA